MRYDLCEAAAEGVDWLTVSRVEVDRPGETYTVDTLEELRDGRIPRPSTSSCWEPTRRCAWRAGASRQRVLELAQLAVAERGGRRRCGRAARRLRGSGGEGRVTTFSMPRIDVSSTEVRERVAAGRPYRFLVPERVAERIEREGLYR